MARISVKHIRLVKTSLVMYSCVVTSCLFLFAASGAESNETHPPNEAEKHWVSTVFDNFTSAADALQWSDIRVVSNWRIQQHAQSKKYRVLNLNDKVVADGTLDLCSRHFSELIKDGDIDPLVRNKAVIVIHGLGEGRSAMQPLVTYLEDNMSASILTFGYASPQATLAAHAHALGKVLAGLPSTTAVSFVGHSMGNLVVRRWLQNAQPEMIGRVNRMGNAWTSKPGLRPCSTCCS
jgi:pimeloyl-ACP methyl ester carboxylesterase